MHRRRFLLGAGSIVATLGGCLGRERDDPPNGASDRTDTSADGGHDRERADDGGENETRQTPEQRLVFVNGDDERHSLQVTFSTDDSDVLDRTADLPVDERRRFPLDVEPGKYAVSATVDEETTETRPISISEYNVQWGSNVFVEIDDGRPDIYWEE